MRQPKYHYLTFIDNNSGVEFSEVPAMTQCRIAHQPDEAQAVIDILDNRATGPGQPQWDKRLIV